MRNHPNTDVRFYVQTDERNLSPVHIIFSLSVGAATGLFISFRTHNRIIQFYDSIIVQLELSDSVK